MTIATTIMNTLNARLAALPGITNVAWPNDGFDRIPDEINLSVFLLPANNATETLDYTESNKGVYQVTVSAPIGNGPAPALDMADSIADHFAADRNLGDIRIRQASISGGSVEGPWYNVAVSINYSVLHNRSV